ncbi:MAG TPA: aminopeptidase [Candidatus Dormibacteraeota bacterium]
MTETPFTPDELARYAGVALDRCLDLRRGELLVLVYEPEHRPLALALAEAAYRRGLRVDANMSDPLMLRAELLHADDAVLGEVPPWRTARMLARTEGNAAALFIDGDSDPHALDDTEPARMAAHARRYREQTAEVMRRIRENLDQSLIVAYPTMAWARQVYPDLAPDLAQRALAEDLLSFCRVGPDDDDGALSRHIDALRERAAVANRLALREVRLRGPGTDLRLGLTEDALWTSALEENAYGRSAFGNLPSEEIYTSPAASATEGTARCTAPLSLDGAIVEDLRVEFRGGRLVRLDAKTDEQRDRLLGLLDGDEGGRRLGELALVDASSRIGQRGRLYWNTLLDENQACHMAFGFGFASCRRGGASSPDMNSSRSHYDVMIGAPDVEVTGTTAGGDTVPLIAGGVWRPA